MARRIAFHERFSRSAVKAFTFRLLVVVTDTLILFFFTRRLDLSLIVGIVLFSNVVRTFLYFFHERAWDDVRWGKSK